MAILKRRRRPPGHVPVQTGTHIEWAIMQGWLAVAKKKGS